MATGVVEKVASEGALIDMRSIRRSVGPQVIETSQSKGSQSTMQVRKSKKGEFIRIHPDGEERLEGATTLELVSAKSREIYLVMGEWAIPDDILDLVDSINLYRAVNHNGSEFLYFFKQSTNDWSLSAGIVVRSAMEKWVRPRANMAAQSYDITTAPVPLPDPTWSNHSFTALLTTAFQGRLITSPDHHVVRFLQGRTHELAA